MMTHDVELGSDRILKPGKLRWLRAIAWLLLLTLLVTTAFAIVAGAGYAIGALATGTSPDSLSQPDRLMQEVPAEVHFIVMTLAALGGLLTYAGLVKAGEHRPPSELTLRPALVEVVGGLGVGAAMMAVTVGLMVTAGWGSIDASPMGSAWRAGGMAVQSGVLEEVIFRAILLRLAWRAFGLWPALVISAAFFGIAHIQNPNSSLFAALCIVVEAGFMLAAFYILTGRLWLSIGVHAGWNFTQGWVFGAAVSGTDFFAGGPLTFTPNGNVPEYLSGAGFGPEASVAGLLVGTAVGGYVLWLAWKKGRFAAGSDEPNVALEADVQAAQG
jgi:membrane protease YdiL (CAAX protease family)